MNFAAVQQAGGQNVIMLGQIVEFKGEGVGRTGKPWKKMVVEDMERERHTVTIRGNLPPATALNQQAQFTISTYQGTSQGGPYTGYSGFCDVLPNYGQQAPQAAGYQPTQQQSPAPPLRQPQQPQLQQQYPRQQQANKQPDWDNINLGKCRHTLYCAVIKAGMTPIDLVADVPMLQAIEELAGLSMNGLGGLPNPDYVGDNPPPPQDEDVPF